MAMEFGKLNFAVGFNRTSAFPLDANSYFEDLASAQAAAAGAAEVGSSDSAYYIGQLIIVTVGGVSDLYQITGTVGNSSLKKFGSASSADELKADLGKLKAKFELLVNGLSSFVEEKKDESGNVTGYVVKKATASQDGIMSKEYASKLDGIAEGANKTIVDAELTADGTNPVQGKAIKAELANLDGDITALEGVVEGKVDKVEGKGLSTNDYDNAAKAIVDGVTDNLAKKVDKVDGMGLSHNDYDDASKAIVDGIEAKVTAEKDRAEKVEQGLNTRLTTAEGKITSQGTDIADLKTKITGLTGAMHFIGESTTDPVGDTGATVEGHTTFASGDVCLYNTKEFVYNGTQWKELGDEGSHLTKTEAASTYETKADAKTKADDLSQQLQQVAEDVETLNTDTIPAAKAEAISEAGKAADTKIAEALKSYTNTTDLNTALGKKLDKSVYNTDKAASDKLISDNAAAITASNKKIAANEKAITDNKAELQGNIDKKVDAVEGKSLVDDTLITKMEGLKNSLPIKSAGHGLAVNELSGDDAGYYEILLSDVKIADVTNLQTELDKKQTAAQVNSLIQAATIKGSKIDGVVANATHAGTADNVGHVLTAGSKTFNGSEDVEITAADLGALTEIPVASAEKLGGVKVGSGIDVTEDGTISVTIPSALVKSVDTTNFAVSAEGKLSFTSVSTDKLTQGTKTLVINGGTASGF